MTAAGEETDCLIRGEMGRGQAVRFARSREAGNAGGDGEDAVENLAAFKMLLNKIDEITLK